MQTAKLQNSLVMEQGQSLLCFNYMPDGGDRTIVNETVVASSDAAEQQSFPCGLCHYWRYFDFSAEGKTFWFSTLREELKSVDYGGGNSTKPEPTTTWGRGGGSCVQTAERPPGCYLLIHVRLDYLGASLSALLDYLLQVERARPSHETMLTINTFDGKELRGRRLRRLKRTRTF